MPDHAAQALGAAGKSGMTEKAVCKLILFRYLYLNLTEPELVGPLCWLVLTLKFTICQ